MGPVVAQNVTVATPTSPFQLCPRRKLGVPQKIPSTIQAPKLSNLPSRPKTVLARNYSCPPLDFRVTRESASSPLPTASLVHPSSPQCEPYKRRVMTPPIEKYQRMSLSDSCSSTDSCASCSNSTQTLTSSSTECGGTISSYEDTPEADSSPTYCSTSSSSSSSLHTCAFSSPSRSISPPNTQIRRRYLPLSPNHSPSTYPRRLFCGDYSPLSSRCCSSSPTYSATSQYSPTSQNSSFALPDYAPNSTKYKTTTTDYFLTSPQSPVYCNSSLNYFLPSLSTISLNDNAQKSPTFIDHSPTTPVYTPYPSYYPVSPDRSPTLMTYFHSPESPKKLKPTAFTQYTCNSTTCNYAQQSDCYQRPTRYFQRSFPYVDSKSSLKYRGTSPTYYPLSPEYIPSIINGNIQEDIPCVCCSPSTSQY